MLLVTTSSRSLAVQSSRRMVCQRCQNGSIRPPLPISILTSRRASSSSSLLLQQQQPRRCSVWRAVVNVSCEQQRLNYRHRLRNTAGSGQWNTTSDSPGSIRTFASSSPPNKRKVVSVNEPVANEKLVAKIRQMKGAMSAAAIQVRVVPDPLQHQQQRPVADETAAAVEASAAAPKPKSASVVVSLAQAIQSAIDADLDLIEISLDQDIPVVTISKVQALVYHGNKNSSKKGGSHSAASQMKEVTMQAGIADNDLQRKCFDILKFLDKGHQCIVTVKAGRKFTWNNDDAAMQALQRVLLLLQDRIEMVKPPTVNPLKNMGTFQVRAKKK
jgi:translation initiation factor IF-3